MELVAKPYAVANFDLAVVVSRLVSKHATLDSNHKTVGVAAQDETVFRSLVREIAMFSGGENRDNVDNMLAMRKRDLKGLHGKVWEVFCRDWLKMEYKMVKGVMTRKYRNVWLLCDVPGDVLRVCGLERLDNGVDIVAELFEEIGAGIPFEGKSKSCYVPVQCKFRSPNKLGYVKKITWDDLSTFCGLVSMSGPWVCGLVMVNSRGVGNRVPKKGGVEKKDKDKDKDKDEKKDVRKQRKTILHERFHTIAFTTFDHTTLDHWQRIAGTNTGYRLVEPGIVRELSGDGGCNVDSGVVNVVSKRKPKKVVRKVGGEEKPETVEELREKRLLRFGM